METKTGIEAPIKKPVIEPKEPTVQPGVLPEQPEKHPGSNPETDPDFFRPKSPPSIEPTKD